MTDITDKQASQIVELINDWSGPWDNEEQAASGFIRELTERLGWTVEPPPVPRYKVTRDGDAYNVKELVSGYLVVVFSGKHPDAEGAARAEAERLNQRGPHWTVIPTGDDDE